jgi:hypothetical protein
MKPTKFLVIIGVALVIVLLAVGIYFGMKNMQTFDKSFSVSTESYRPYDVKFFHDQVKKRAKQFELKKTADDLISITSLPDKNTIIMVVNQGFYPNKTQVDLLLSAVSGGNTLVIYAIDIDSSLLNTLYYCPSYESTYFPPRLIEDSMKVNFKNRNGQIKTFEYPGHSPTINRFDSLALWNSKDYAATQIDTLIVNKYNQIEMIRLKVGDGEVYLAKNTLLFSNYFLLHKNNFQFFNAFAEEIDLAHKTVYWSNYGTKKEVADDAGKSKVMEIVNKNPPLKWFFVLVLMGILLFVFNYLRPFLRPIPVKKEAKNFSEGYLNVISELYWQEDGNKAIAEKMILQFNENVFSKTRIQLKDYSDEEINRLKRRIDNKDTELDELKFLVRSVKESEQIGIQSLNKLYELMKKVEFE